MVTRTRRAAPSLLWGLSAPLRLLGRTGGGCARDCAPASRHPWVQGAWGAPGDVGRVWRMMRGGPKSGCEPGPHAPRPHPCRGKGRGSGVGGAVHPRSGIAPQEGPAAGMGMQTGSPLAAAPTPKKKKKNPKGTPKRYGAVQRGRAEGRCRDLGMPCGARSPPWHPRLDAGGGDPPPRHILRALLSLQGLLPPPPGRSPALLELPWRAPRCSARPRGRSGAPGCGRAAAGGPRWWRRRRPLPCRTSPSCSPPTWTTSSLKVWGGADGQTDEPVHGNCS